MTMNIRTVGWGAFVVVALFALVGSAHADTLTLTSGANATTTPNVATAITGFQIVGPAGQTTPVKLRATSGTLNLSTVAGVTMSGNGTGTVNLSGTVGNVNTALSTLTYTRSSTGTDTLEVSLVDPNQIFFPDNNHVYEYIGGNINWNNARIAAEARTAYGATGYLATVTSTGENNFIRARLSGDAWIGGSDSATEGTWKWVGGPEAGTTFWQGTGGGSTSNYANWNPGEPNQSGDEDCAETYIADGTWNDLPCSASVSGYVVEYGSPGNTPTVVAVNISITTADVPAVTTLAPSNGSSLVSPTASLVIGFSKTVTKETGAVEIRKYADDSLIETIDVSGSQVSGSGTATITIDPATTLPEGTQVYVTIPSTAFKDASNNFFEGIASKTTWSFTTNDVTAPVLSAIDAVPTDTGVTVTWESNESSSTRLLYAADESYGIATSEADTSVRVTSHTVTLSSLAECTKYYYKAVSRDAFANTATSSGMSFITTGCSAGTIPLSSAVGSVTVSTPSSTTLTETGHTLSVETPADFTTQASSVVIQIKGIAADPVIGLIGKPSPSLQTAAPVVFDVKALIDSTTLVDTFDVPVTITYTYSATDIEGITESSLWLYHYHDDAWQALDSCSVATEADTITCTAPGFSIFGLFGSPIPTSSASSGVTLEGRIRNLVNAGNITDARTLALSYGKELPQGGATVLSVATEAPVVFKRNLTIGSTGDDVRLLQQFLNARGYILAAAGPGSVGNETTRFGRLTKVALANYQRAHGILPTIGYFGPITRAKINSVY